MARNSGGMADVMGSAVKRLGLGETGGVKEYQPQHCCEYGRQHSVPPDIRMSQRIIGLG